MKKLLQNRIAESRLAMPVMWAYATVVWLLCGLVNEGWWAQFACFAVTAQLMVELNNQNALIRIYSRMVACSFIALTCAACPLMPSVRGGIVQTCLVSAYLLLFHTYQDKQSTGLTYYAFLLLGIGTMANVWLFYFVPIVWLLMGTHLLSLSWRTWAASVAGILTPYWLGTCWMAFANGFDFEPLSAHLAQLGAVEIPIGYGSLSTGLRLALALTGVAALTGIAHYIGKSSGDKIRTRMLFGCFIWMDVAAIALLAFQPQHADWLLRIIIINTAPLVAHFIALTTGRAANAWFCIMAIATQIVTGYNVWTISSLF